MLASKNHLGEGGRLQLKKWNVQLQMKLTWQVAG